MKYRSDFVTNSSSTSFGGAGAESLLALLMALFSLCSDEGDTQDGEYVLYKSVMPAGTNKISAMDAEPVWLYAQAFKRTEKGEELDQEATQTISFEILKGANFVTLGTSEIVDDWMATYIIPCTPGTNEEPPTKIEAKAILRMGKKKYTIRYSFDYEAEPKLTIKPDKCNFLTKTGEKSEFKVKISNPGPEAWSMDIESDNWADKICKYSLEDKNTKETEAKLVITEDDVETLTGTSQDQYTKGKLTVKATLGEKEVSDYIDVYVWREGLYLLKEVDYDRETGDILINADMASEGGMKATIFDLRYMIWNEEAKQLKCDTSVFESDLFCFDDPYTEDNDTEALLEKNKPTIKYEGERPSNLPSGKFSICMDKPIPGKKGERYRFKLPAVIDDGVEAYEVQIPFAIIPANMTVGNEAWQIQYDYCKKIINTYIPEGKREELLKELEENKYWMGVEELKQHRMTIWNKAQDIIFKQRDSYLEDAAWYDNALYAAEWVQWLNDRAFNVVAGTLTGPVGVIVATQCKELIQDIIAKIVTCKATDTWTSIAEDLVYNRFVSTLGGGIDAKYFSEPEVSKKWIAAFFMYKWVFHWAFDKDEKGNNKGCLEGLKAAAWDLTGVGLEEKMKPYIASMAQKGGWSQNMAVDEYTKKVYEAVKPYLSEFISNESSGGK